MVIASRYDIFGLYYTGWECLREGLVVLYFLCHFYEQMKSRKEAYQMPTDRQTDRETMVLVELLKLVAEKCEAQNSVEPLKDYISKLEATLERP